VKERELPPDRKNKRKRNAHPEVEKDRQIEKEKDAMMNTQEDQTKNRDLWQF
jgi:hypothetical protein